MAEFEDRYISQALFYFFSKFRVSFVILVLDKRIRTQYYPFRKKKLRSIYSFDTKLNLSFPISFLIFL